MNADETILASCLNNYVQNIYWVAQWIVHTLWHYVIGSYTYVQQSVAILEWSIDHVTILISERV